MKLTRLFSKVLITAGLVGVVMATAVGFADNSPMAKEMTQAFIFPRKSSPITLLNSSDTKLEAAALPITQPADTVSNQPTATTLPDLIPVPGMGHVEVRSVDASTEDGAPKQTTRLWNLQDADILSVINEVSQDTGKNFIVDPRVNGKITLISSKPLKRGQVYPVFLSVLGALGYSAIPSGSVIKIVPNMESGEQATKVANALVPGKGDEVVVRVIPLENVSASQLIPVIRPMLPQWSNVSSYSPGNVLILLGRASNLERIIDVIQDVDKASNSGIQIITLKHASAQQVASVVTNLQNASRTTGDSAPVSIAVDERSNSILLGGPQKMRLRMRVLISQLDSPSTAAAGNTEVVYLRYLQAKTLAPLLSKIAENLLGKDTSSSSAAVSAPPPDKNGKSKSDKGLALNTYIQAEPNTNAIVITAPPALMKALKSVIAKLDIRPAQVLVQAIIAEIDENNLMSLGIQWGTVASNGTVQTAGTSLISFPNLGAGVVGLIPGADIQAVLSILQNKTGVDILSTPSVMVLDNQKATIEVGQDVPIQTGSYSTQTGGTTGTTPTPFTTIDMKPVTLKLDVIPQINLGTAVRLKLNLKNDTLQNPQNPTLTPIINTSKISNSVIINSNDILVLGGLMSNSNNESINKVPILGDIPILGKLIFQQKTTSQQKKNLMVFLKPVIIHDSELAMTISEQKYMEVRNTQANYVDDMESLGKKRQNTLLPPWKNGKDLPRPFETS